MALAEWVADKGGAALALFGSVNPSDPIGDARERERCGLLRANATIEDVALWRKTCEECSERLLGLCDQFSDYLDLAETSPLFFQFSDCFRDAERCFEQFSEFP